MKSKQSTGAIRTVIGTDVVRGDGDNMSVVAVQTAGGVATIRVDRPPMNALDTTVQAGLAAAAAEVAERDDVHAVVLYGGEKVFAAGADVKEMADWDYRTMVLRSQALQDSFTAIARIPKPTIAAVTGYALGGGLELALACDLRVCGDNAKLGLPEILLGIIPGAGGTQRLPRLVGTARAKDLILTGRFVNAEEALRIGLVDRVVAPDDVFTEATALAEQLASGASLAQRAALEAIDRGVETDLTTGLAIERSLFAGLFATDDRTIGMESFLANGPGKAEFTGR
jgi:enoyl-CoA hydratase/carnithine racemase